MCVCVCLCVRAAGGGVGWGAGGCPLTFITALGRARSTPPTFSTDSRKRRCRAGVQMSLGSEAGGWDSEVGGGGGGGRGAGGVAARRRGAGK